MPTITWIGAVGTVGTWNNPLLWDLGRIPVSGDDIVIGAGRTVVILNGDVQTLHAGTVHNDGTIFLGSTGNFTQLLISGAVNLTGGGQLLMSDSDANRLISTTANSVLNIVDHTIGGSGDLIGNGALRIVNEASGLIDASGSLAQLRLIAITVDNAGTIQGSGSAGLSIGFNGFGATIDGTRGGTIKALDGSKVDITSGGRIIGGTLMDEGSGRLQILGAGATLDGRTSTITIDDTATLHLTNGANVTLQGTLNNRGEFALDAVGGAPTQLLIDGAATLHGGGRISMTDGIGNRVVSSTPNSTLTNVDNTISGSGVLVGNSSLRIINEAAGVIEGSGLQTQLQLQNITIDNAGTIQGRGAAGLAIGFNGFGATIDGTRGGVIKALDGSSVDFTGGSRIIGGTLMDEGSGRLQILGNAATFDGRTSAVTIDNAATLHLTNGATTNLQGTIENRGEFAFGSIAGGNTNVQVDGPTFLTGGGRVSMTDSIGNRIYSFTAGSTLTNVDNTISGSGNIFGNGALRLINQSAGTIEAVGATGLTLATVTVENLGTFKASEGSTLYIQGAAFNNLVNNTLTGGSYIVDDNSRIAVYSQGTAIAGLGAGTTVTLNTGSFLGETDGTPTNINQSLASIAFGATLTLSGFNSTWSNALSIGGRLELEDDLFVGSSISVLGQGVVRGSGAITAGLSVASDGVVRAEGGTLTIDGATTGDGMFEVATGSRLEFRGAVNAAVRVQFDGIVDSSIDTIEIDQASTFAATIERFNADDRIHLTGIAATSAELVGGNLLSLRDASNAEIATIRLAGDFTGFAFATASDGASGSYITLVNGGGGNTAPSAVEDRYTVGRNSTVTINATAGVLTNDLDADGDPLTAMLRTGPSHGTLSLAADGSFVYTPTTGYTGHDSFTYAVSDGTAESTPTTVTLDVVRVNQAPVARGDDGPNRLGYYPSTHGTTIHWNANASLLRNDTDPDGDYLTAWLVTQPYRYEGNQRVTDPSITVNVGLDGSVSINAVNPGVYYFEYEARDPSGLSSGPVEVELQVGALPPPPGGLNLPGDADSNPDAPTGGRQVGGILGELRAAIDAGGSLALSYGGIAGPEPTPEQKAEFNAQLAKIIEILRQMQENADKAKDTPPPAGNGEVVGGGGVNAGSGVGGGWGDIHANTIDGLAYDFQAAGEFVALRSKATADFDFDLQIRTVPTSAASLTSAIAIGVNGHRVAYDAAESVLRIDGVEVPLFGLYDIDGGSGLSGQVSAVGNTFAFTFDEGAQAVLVRDRGSYLDFQVVVAASRLDDYEGILRSFDGQVARPDGSLVSTNPSLAEFYGTASTSFANAWRVGAGSLFDYAPGESTATYTINGFPGYAIRLQDLPQSVVAAAAALVDEAGITDPIARENAIYDLVVTGDPRTLASNATTTPGGERLSAPTGASGQLVGVGAETIVSAETDGGVTSYSFVVYRTNATGAMTVDYDVVTSGLNITSSADVNDFVGGALPSGTVTFADGQSTASIIVQVVGDSAVERNEQFALTLSNVSDPAAILAVPSIMSLIRDDDAAPVTAVGSAFAIDQDAVLTGALLEELTSANGAPIEAIVTRYPEHGRLYIEDGEFIYVPDAGYSGTDFFYYRASDGFAASDDQLVMLVVEPTATNVAPEITSSSGGATATIAVTENTTTVVTVTATDANSGQVMTYRISGGADAALFTIDARTGQLAFREAPNFEERRDADGDNRYDVAVEVTDGLDGRDVQNITVIVGDVAEAAVIGGTRAGQVREDMVITANGQLTVADEDAGQAAFRAGAFDSSYGRLTLSANGGWTYALNNAAAPVQALVTGQQLVDAFTVLSVDGTSTTVDITIDGTDEPAFNLIAGTSKSETLRGTTGADVITANGGHDVVLAGNGNDVMRATINDGNDYYDGGAGFDTVDYSAISRSVRVDLSDLLGGCGLAVGAQIGVDVFLSVENVIGSQAGDVFVGNRFANRFDGGRGDDVLTGGRGDDVFVFGINSGRDRITDFDDAGNDRIEVSRAMFADFADIQSHMHSERGHVIIESAEFQFRLMLQHTSLASVGADDFLFV